jgi:hypothetical protein
VYFHRQRRGQNRTTYGGCVKGGMMKISSRFRNSLIFAGFIFGISGWIYTQQEGTQAPKPPVKKVKRLNVARSTIEKGTEFAKNFFLYKTLPDFDKNYAMLKQKFDNALDIPRIDMPVIEPEDIDRFQKDIVAGHIDIFKPYAKHELFKGRETGDLDIIFPKDLKDDERGKTWLTLGIIDGDPEDDKIVAELKHIAAKDLRPTQSQLWLNKLLKNIFKFGVPKPGASILERTIITSKEGYILDGHHRFGQVILADPFLKLRVLVVPLDISTLLRMGRSYGGAIGNEPKA